MWWNLILYALAGIGIFYTLPELFFYLIALIFSWIF